MPGKSRTYHKFMSLVEQGNDCWIWHGHRNRDGYGLFNSIQFDTVLAHRVSYSFFKGGFDKNLKICHTCDNPRCVNPTHLFLGTDKDNSDDKIKKGRFVHWNDLKTHCKNGHLFTTENTRIRRCGRKRTCTTCEKIRHLKNKEKKNGTE